MERSSLPIIKSVWLAGVIDADLVELFLGHVLKALHALVKAEAERQMAGGIFIEERIVEEQAGLMDRRLLRHERALAKIVAALVHADDLLENILSLFGLNFHGAALFKADGEVFDELPLIGEGLRGVHDALGGAAVGRGENFLGRHVGVIDDTRIVVSRPAWNSAVGIRPTLKSVPFAEW